MPVKIKNNKGNYVFIYPSEMEKKLKFKDYKMPLEIDPNFYIQLKKIK